MSRCYWLGRGEQRSFRQELSLVAAKVSWQMGTSFGDSLWSSLGNELGDILINTFLGSEGLSQGRDVTFLSC